MNYDLEQQIRSEAHALRALGILTWDRRLRANGLDPMKWSDEVEGERAAQIAAAKAAAEATAKIIAAAPSGMRDAARNLIEDEPELWWSTRTEPACSVLGRRAAELGSKTFDPADNTIECVWTTGASVMRIDGAGLYNEVLDVTPKAVRLGRLNAGASFLNSHRSDDLAQVIGSVVQNSARIAGGKGSCRILLSRAAGSADIVDNIKAGVIRNISVGYLIHGSEWSEGDAGIPTCRVTDWEPFEISAVAVPADAGAQIRSKAAAARTDLRSATQIVAYARARSRARLLGI